jgi:hypothetical protein
MSLAVGAELGALHLNAKETAYLQQILAEMGHPQPQTPIQTNNLMAEGVINHKIQPKQKRQWTSASIGYATAKLKAYFEFTGNWENSILLIT